MKNFIYTFIAFLFSASISAQAPESFKYQAVARDAGGNVITSQTVGMQVSILQESISGTPVYIETFAPTTNQFGLINLEIGKGMVVSGTFSGIDWGSNSYFLKLELDAAGGTSYTEMGTSQLLSVPYALHAQTVKSITEADPVFGTSVASGITGTDTTNWNNKLDSYTEADPVFGTSVASGITGTDTTNWNNKLDAEVDGSVTNEIQNLNSVLAQGTNADNLNITNLAEPVNNQDASTKAYVDALEARIRSLISTLRPPVQQRLDEGETPYQIYQDDNSLLDSLYGKTYEGGLIAYLNTSDGSGLVAASSNQSTGIQWYNGSNIVTGATDLSIGAGQTNTTTIVNAQGAGSYAAQLCDDFEFDIYSDWFLPSIYELEAMHLNLHQNGLGNLSAAFYWSSTENDSARAWGWSFNTGSSTANAFKSGTYRVRAVRAF